jgi:hypothetical protein
MRKLRLWLWVFTLAMVLPGLAWSASQATSSAERLARLVPEDTLAYLATSGIDELKPAFDKTVMAQFANDPNVQSLIDKATALLIARVAGDANDPGKAAVLDLAKSVYRLPFLAGIAQRKAKDTPAAYGYVFVEAGPSRDKVVAALGKLEAMAGRGEIVEKTVGSMKVYEPNKQDDPPVYWGWQESTLILGLNDPNHLAVKNLRARAGHPAAAALSQLPAAGDALIMHADLRALHGLLLMAAAKADDPNVLRVVTTLSTQLGLADLQTLALRVGFKDKGIATDGVLQTSYAKGPLLGLIRPADLSLLDAADANAISAAAWNIDLAGLYDVITQTVKAIGSAEEYARFEKGLAEVEGRLGFKIRKDLLAGLSGPMALCSVEAPDSGLRSGATLVVQCRQPEAVDKALAALAKMAAEDSKGSVSVGATVQDGYTLHCVSPAQLTMLGLMPTWVVAKDRLLLATNNRLAAQALRQFISGAPVKSPLRASASYKQVCGRLPEDPLLVRYTDTAHHARLFLQALRPYWPLLTVAAARTGIQLPVALPTFDRIVDQLPPSGFTCWREQNGLRWHGEGPSIAGKGLAVAAVAAGIAMPAFARARGASEQAISMNNLKQIGLGCVMYADDHNGTFPPNLQTLVEKKLVSSEVLQPPTGRRVSRYVYIADQTAKTDTHNILVHEDPAQLRGKACALFPDGHVEALSREDLQKKLEETYKRLDREMPK